jgi:TolB protein
MNYLSHACKTSLGLNLSGLFFMCLSVCTFAQTKKDTISFVQTLDVYTGKIDTVLTIKSHFEAPNWHPDNYLLLNS